MEDSLEFWEFSRKTCLGNNLIFSQLKEAIPKSAFNVEVLHTFIHYKNVTYIILLKLIMLLKCSRTFYLFSCTQLQLYSLPTLQLDSNPSISCMSNCSWSHTDPMYIPNFRISVLHFFGIKPNRLSHQLKCRFTYGFNRSSTEYKPEPFLYKQAISTFCLLLVVKVETMIDI